MTRRPTPQPLIQPRRAHPRGGAEHHRPAPNSRDSAFAVERTASTNRLCRPDGASSRSTGPTIPSPPITRPVQSNTGAANPASPSVASWSSTAYPRSRTVSSTWRNASGSVTVRPVSGRTGADSSPFCLSSPRHATIACPSAQACHGTAAPTSRICARSSGRNARCTTTTLCPDSPPTHPASPVCRASGSAQAAERARSSDPSRYALPNCSTAGPSAYLPPSTSCTTSPCRSSVRSIVCTVGFGMSTSSEISETPRRGVPEASASRICAARSTARVTGTPFGIAGLSSAILNVRPIMVGTVPISHSSGLADGTAELVGQIAGGARVVAAGGTEDGRLGTSTQLILDAIAQADQGEGVLLIPDLGSSVLTARSVLAELDRDAIVLADAPFVEGAVAAGVAASIGADLAAVARAAEEARDARKF